MASHGPALPRRRPAPGAYDLFPQESVSTWLDGLQAKIRAGLSGEEPLSPVRPMSPLRARSPGAIDHQDRETATGERLETYSNRGEAMSQHNAMTPFADAQTSALDFGPPTCLVESGGGSCSEAASDVTATDEEDATGYNFPTGAASHSHVIELGDSDEDDEEEASSCSDMQGPERTRHRSSENETSVPYQLHHQSNSEHDLGTPDVHDFDVMVDDDSSAPLREDSEEETGSTGDSSEALETEEEAENDELDTDDEGDSEGGGSEEEEVLPHGSETQPIDLLDSDDDEELVGSDSGTDSHSDGGDENPYPTPPFNDPELGTAAESSTSELPPTSPLAPNPSYYSQVPDQHQWGHPDVFAEPPPAAVLGAVLHDLSQNVLQEPLTDPFVHGFPSHQQATPIDPELLEVHSQQTGSVSGVFSELPTVRNLQAYVLDGADEQASGDHFHLNVDFRASQDLRVSPFSDAEAVHSYSEQYHSRRQIGGVPFELGPENVDGLEGSSTSPYPPPEMEVEEVHAGREDVVTSLVSDESRESGTPRVCDQLQPPLSLAVQNEIGPSPPPATATCDMNVDMLRGYQQPREQRPTGGGIDDHVAVDEKQCHQEETDGPGEGDQLSEDVGSDGSLSADDPSGPGQQQVEAARTIGTSDRTPVGDSEIVPDESDPDVDSTQNGEDNSIVDSTQDGVEEPGQAESDDSARASYDSTPTPELTVYVGEGKAPGKRLADMQATPQNEPPQLNQKATGGRRTDRTAIQTDLHTQNVDPQTSLLSESDDEVSSKEEPPRNLRQAESADASRTDVVVDEEVPEGANSLEPLSVIANDHTCDGASKAHPGCLQPGAAPASSASQKHDQSPEIQLRATPDHLSNALRVDDVEEIDEPPNDQSVVNAIDHDGIDELNKLHRSETPTTLPPDRRTFVSENDVGRDLETRTRTNDVDRTSILASNTEASSLLASVVKPDSLREKSPLRSSDDPLTMPVCGGPGEGETTAEQTTAREIGSSESAPTDTPEFHEKTAPSVGQPREATPEYRPLRHLHGRGRVDHTPPPVLRLPQHPQHPPGQPSPSVIEPPVTRSNCGYRKLQLAEGDYNATVLVPQCTLGDAEKLDEEGATQMGPPTPAEERWAQNNMPPVRQLHPALHSKLSRITGPTMLQSYSTDMSPIRDRTSSADSEHWHVFILEAGEGSIEYDRSARRLSARPSVFRTPEPNRDPRAGPFSTPTSRRKRSLSAVTEVVAHMPTGRKSAQSTHPVETSTSPLRRSSRLRGASQVPSETSEAPEPSQGASTIDSRRVTRAMAALETSSTAASKDPTSAADDGNDTSAGGSDAQIVKSPSDSHSLSNAPSPAVSTRQRKRKLGATADGDQDDDVRDSTDREHREAPKRGFGWSLRQWFSR